MSRPVNPIICDGCGKTKRETNGWWTARTFPEHPELGFYIGHGTNNCGVSEVLYDLCGRECVMQFVSGQIEKQVGKQAKG